MRALYLLIASLVFTLATVACGPKVGGSKAKGTGGGDGFVIGNTDGTDGTDSTGGTDATDSTEGPKGACTPFSKTCVGNAWVACNFNGTAWSEPKPCGEGTVCSQGGCGPCPEGEKLCQGKDIIQCAADAVATRVDTCPMGCWLAACVECEVGTKECRSGTEGPETWECLGNAEGAQWVKMATCPGDTDCVAGICVNPCSDDIKLNTNQGCDYYALDLENSESPGTGGTLPAADSQFAVIVSNPSDTQTLEVTVHETQKAPAMVTENIAPGGLTVIKLGPRNITGTMQGELAWRIKGNRPFVAYQFNPLDNVNPVFSNDASLLLPVNALGKDYMVMTGSGGGPFVTVVGTKSQTDVTITPTTATEAGGGIPALAAGESWTTTIGAAEVLNLRAAGTAKETLTGTVVTANKNIAVFGGNVAANTADRCCADHLEQQMFPTSAWGSTYVATKSQPRMAEDDHWRILALQDATEVAFTGGVENPKLLNAGEFVDVRNKANFVIKATKPILVGQFLASSYEILPDDVYCNGDADCASGVCSGGNGAGRCVDTCQGTQSNCGPNELCLDNLFMSEDAPQNGGSCFPRVCGPGKPACPGNAQCSDPTAGGHCLESCFGSCSNTAMMCDPVASFCLPNGCNSSAECAGSAWCSPPTPDGGGACWKSCAAQSDCPNNKDACLPPGFAADPSVTKGICLPEGCTTDAQCESGHTCAIQDGQTEGGCEPIGDPAFILAVPAEQFRDEYVFLTPNAYKEDYVNIIAPADAFVTLGNQQLAANQFTKIDQSDFMVARVQLEDGTHKITATKPFGIVVYGYHDDVSYGYPGGANLFDLGN